MNGDITNEQVIKVKISQLNIGDSKTSKNGKTFWQVGIKVGDKWANGLVWSSLEKVNTELQEGESATLMFYEEEYNGKNYRKWKFPTNTDLLQMKYKNLEKRVEALESIIVP